MEFSLLCFAEIVNRFRGFFCMTVLIFISKETAMRKMTFTAMAAVLICVCSWITIPFTIPFTMQTFAVFFAVLFLGGKNGIAAEQGILRQKANGAGGMSRGVDHREAKTAAKDLVPVFQKPVRPGCGVILRLSAEIKGGDVFGGIE